MDRLELREAILDCTACELHERCTMPVPWSGPEGADVVVLGEAPGRQEDHHGTPFVGPAGDAMRAHLARVGIDPDGVAYVNVCACFPNGTPEREHIEACAKNKAMQLEMVGPKFVLLAGQVALKSVVWAADIQAARGRPFWDMTGRWLCWPTFHPAAGLKNKVYDEAIHEDLVRFVEMRDAGRPETYVPDTCAACKVDAIWWGPSMLGWCDLHMPAEERARYDARMAFVKREFEEAKARVRDAAEASPDASAA